MYFGAWPQLTLYISMYCLYNTRDRMGSQCSCWREPVAKAVGATSSEG